MTTQPINFMPSGDLTFREGKLYCAGYELPSYANAIFEIDLAQPSNSQVVMYLNDLPLGYSAWGIITTGAYCDSVRTFITVTNQGSPLYQPNLVYELDFSAQTATFLCDTPGPIVGATTPDEFRFSDCSVLLDLDTLSAGLDYQALAVCDTLPLAISDSSAELYSGYYIDSLRLRLLPLLPDAPAERLTVQPVSGMTVQGQGTATLLLQNNGGAKDIHFRQALLSARYHNDAMPRTPGPRTLEVMLFTGAGADTAYTFIDIPESPEAGPDTAMSFCAHAPGFDLNLVLSPGATPGGFWFPGDGVFHPDTDPPGVYAYVVGDDALCGADTAFANISVEPALQTALSATICAGETYAFGPQQLTSAGVYTDTLASALTGCDSVLTLSLTVQPALQTALSATICAGETYAFGGQQLTAAGVYTDTLASALTGCDSVLMLSLSQWPLIQAEWETAAPLCPGDSSGWIELIGLNGGAQPLVFQLQDHPPVTTALFDQLPAGLWTVSALDAEGCVAVWTFTLDDPPAWTLYLEDVIAIQAGASTTIPLEISLPGGYSYTWSPPEGLSCTDCQQPLASPSDSVWYAVTVTDSNGCKAEDAILIRVEKSGGIYIPTAFSPDGDGTNEVFQIAGDPSEIERIDVFQVYNRWGGLVFERRGVAPNDSGNGWDGTLRGKALPTDVYIWYAEIRLKSGKVLKKKGDVTLLR
ncbi:MAG: gliding motility-associated C-terminal domain-containing protein [Saprospiraceae bacterium]